MSFGADSMMLNGVKYQIFAINLNDNAHIDATIENLLKVKEQNLAKGSKLKQILEIKDENERGILFKEHIKKLGLEDASLDDTLTTTNDNLELFKTTLSKKLKTKKMTNIIRIIKYFKDCPNTTKDEFKNKTGMNISEYLMWKRKFRLIEKNGENRYYLNINVMDYIKDVLDDVYNFNE